MRFVDSIQIKIPGINQKFELGDLTIFIGRSNSGKSRILKAICDGINAGNSTVGELRMDRERHILKKQSPLPVPIDSAYKTNGIELAPQINKIINKIIQVHLLTSYRQPKGNINGLSTPIARYAQSAKKIDSTINDLGAGEVETKSGARRSLSEQGSGLHNLLHVSEALDNKAEVILIDEPEVSQFPYGKIEILKAIIDASKQKQVIVATHDPTLINQHLLRKMADNNLKIAMYSFCGAQFEKIDMSKCDPETHVGYLSQTYSGKPVHLIIEGQTEFYAFQSLLFKYAQFKKIPYYPKFINKISISGLAGGQWNVNKHHLPSPEYYDVLVVLDGEHKGDVEDAQLAFKTKTISSVSECEAGGINWLFLESTKIEDAFRDIFDTVSEDKPVGLSMQIWKMTDEQMKEALNDKKTQQIISVIDWCLKKAGATV